MGTAATESNFKNFVQFGGGPARGMFQMEKATYNWLMSEWLMAKRHNDLREKVLSLATVPSPPVDHLVSNHKFAAALARIRYLAAPGVLPPDLDGQAKYWWHNYNGCSPGGHGPKAYLQAWVDFCAKLYNGKTQPLPAPSPNAINPPPLLPGLIIC